MSHGKRSHTVESDASTQRSRLPITPLDELEAFHAQIRRALTSLRVLVNEARKEHLQAPEAAHLHEVFDGPLLWHDEDEEVSLLPRLRRTDLTEEERRVVERCHRGHDRLESLVDEIVPEVLKLARGEPFDLDLLERDAIALENLLASHFELEERQLFPLARKRLKQPDLEAIRDEIHARHGTRRGREKRAVAL
jgi:hemerythrin-like domain-containing protein